VPYIPAFKSLFSLFNISISTGKFNEASAIGAIKVIFPVNSLSGYTLAFTLISEPTLRKAIWFSFTVTLNFNLDTLTKSNNGVPEVTTEPGSMYFLFTTPFIVDLMEASPKLIFAWSNLAFAVARFNFA